MIRPALDEDLPAVGRVHARSRREAYVDLLPAEALARVTPETQERAWRERLAATPDPSLMLVAERDREVIGFAFATQGDDVPELNAIHLLPEVQGTGVGRALHDALLVEVADWGRDEIVLWVLRGNERAQAFYRRNGWVHDGTTSEHEIGGAVVPILRYRRALPGR